MTESGKKKMKKQFGTNKLITGALVIIGALAFASTASAKNPKEVEVEIVNGELEITTDAGTNDCPSDEPRENGCIKVKNRKQSRMYFELTGDRTCHEEPGNNWELNAIYLGGYNSPEKPGVNDFGFNSTSKANYDKVNDDFTGVDRTTGRVSLIKKTAKKLGIKNLNQNEYVVWYKIEAICERVDGGAPHIATSDPRVKNGGNQ